MTRKPGRVSPEQDLQKAVAQYLYLALDPQQVVWTAINPVPAKSKAAAGLSKAMGLKAGIPDLCFWWAGRSALIELKAMSGTWSDAQKDMMARLRGIGVPTRTARSLAEVDLALDDLGIPHRRVHYLESRHALKLPGAPERRTA